jgi:hypothetical protein
LGRTECNLQERPGWTEIVVSFLTETDRGATNDTQIVCLRWAFLDFDAVRAADISSTDEELALALAVRDKFLADHPEIRESAIWGCSGNGGWILVRLPDLPNDEAHNALVKRFIGQVGRSYDTKQVKVDPSTCNASRVMGAISTALKGLTGRKLFCHDALILRELAHCGDATWSCDMRTGSRR